MKCSANKNGKLSGYLEYFPPALQTGQYKATNAEELGVEPDLLQAS